MALKKAPKAYDNQKFIHSHDARSLRVLAEFLEPEQRFREQEIHNTIVFFGSARKNTVAETQKKKIGNGADRGKMLIAAKAHEECIKLSKMLTEWSMTIKEPEKRFLICSGGGPGIMEAANEGAKLAGGKSIGLNISLPFEQEPNQHITPSLNFEFHYFFIRKFWFLYYAKALVAFPGGFGTFDELFELLTLVQNDKLDKKVPIVMYGKTFWNDVMNLDALVEYGVIKESDLDLIHISDTPEDAFEYITENLKKNYF